jgi:hypothetical protein
MILRCHKSTYCYYLPVASLSARRMYAEFIIMNSVPLRDGREGDVPYTVSCGIGKHYNFVARVLGGLWRYIRYDCSVPIHRYAMMRPTLIREHKANLHLTTEDRALLVGRFVHQSVHQQARLGLGQNLHLITPSCCPHMELLRSTMPPTTIALSATVPVDRSLDPPCSKHSCLTTVLVVRTICLLVAAAFKSCRPHCQYPRHPEMQ